MSSKPIAFTKAARIDVAEVVNYYRVEAGAALAERFVVALRGLSEQSAPVRQPDRHASAI